MPAARPVFPEGFLSDRKVFSMSTASLLFMVVDDNESFLRILCDMLHSLGHRTRSASSAEDAMAQIAQNHVDVLMTDIRLPGMSGVDLARKAVNEVPGIRIIFSSGHGYLLPDAPGFDFDLLHKPYFVNQLRQVIG